MNELLDTILLSNGKSSYLIDLLKLDSGTKYVRIEYVQNKVKRIIYIHPKILSDLVEVLSNYKRKIENDLTIIERPKGKIPKEIQDKSTMICSRYLKGVPTKDLAMQFDCNENLIEMILGNKDIEIVQNKLSTDCHWQKKYKKRRKSNYH
jgi:hypothetical protein